MLGPTLLRTLLATWLLLAALPAGAGAITLSARVTGTVNGDPLDATVSATMTVGMGSITGVYTERPGSFADPIGSILVDHMITCTINSPSGVPADQMILSLVGSSYEVTRTYSFEDGSTLTTAASVTVSGAAMDAVGSMNGSLPDLPGAIDSVLASLQPNGANSVLDTGSIVLATGEVITWSGEHSYSTGEALGSAYDVMTTYADVSHTTTDFSYNFVSQVPEPGSAALLAEALLLLVAARRFR